jgi:6,7-dimethyl-8-ribityllumazine synthase
MARMLVISSQVHKEFSERQLKHCLNLLRTLPYEVEVEKLDAGTYEIPFLIQAYNQKNPFDGYIALGLVLDTNPGHSQYISSHIQTCFTQFALQQIIVGNGIIWGATEDELATKIDSDDPCLSAYPSACKAVDALIRLKNKMQ